MANLAPFPIFRAFDANGNPLVGGQLYTYVSGTTTPKVSYTDHTGSVANTNPVILDSRGEARVWLDGTYTLRLIDSLGSTLWTVDEVTGVGTGSDSGGTVTASEWLDQPDSPTYISATQYSVPGDRTADYHVGRRQRAQVSGGISYGRITASVFSTGATTITVVNDSITLDGGLSAVALGINSADNPSISVDCVEGIGTLDTVPTGAIFMWGTGTAPSGYLLLDGSDVDRTTYAALFTLWGTTFGSGDGSTTFGLPDMRGRSPMGFGASPDAGEGGTPGTARSLADKVGAEEITQTISQMPLHGHPWRHSGDPGDTASDGGFTTDGQQTTRGPYTGSPTGTVGQQIGGEGGGQPMDIVSPALVLGFIVKT